MNIYAPKVVAYKENHIADRGELFMGSSNR